MTLSDISYSILEAIRQGHIVDDERIDVRLINSWVVIERASYLKDFINKNSSYPENSMQDLEVDIDLNSDNGIDYLSSSEVPKFIDTKFGSAIEEVASLDLNQYNFTLVNNNHYKMAGNGKFYSNAIFATYFNDKIYFKSKNHILKSIEKCRISGVFENPTDVDGFDVDTDDYPIDIQGINAIKKSIYNMDLRVLLNGVSDEVSDSSGEIK